MTGTETGDNNVTGGIDRRTVLQTAGAAAAVVTFSAGPSGAKAATAAGGESWVTGPMRWVHLCFTEDDPGRYDPQFWFDFFKRADIQGVVLSAGGDIAFYPTKVPFHTRSPYLGDHDMFGDMVKGCKKLGIRTMARVDPQALGPDAAAAHPDWFFTEADGSLRHNAVAKDLVVTCANGPVYFEYMPQVLKEVTGVYKLDGIFGNGVGSKGLCHCINCKTKFKKASGFDLPPAIGNPQDPVVKAWNLWIGAVASERNDLWDKAIKSANPEAFGHFGGVGNLEDPRAVWPRLPASFADRQTRSGEDPAWRSGRNAKEINSVLQGRPMAGIMSIHSGGNYRWMDSCQDGAELTHFFRDGIAQGFRPSLCKFKAEVFDKRWVPVMEKLYSWHSKNENYLRNTQNLARVAMVQSSATDEFYVPPAQPGPVRGAAGGGRGSSEVADAGNGFYQALTESRIPFEILPDRLLDPEFADRYKVLVLPNIAALSDKYCEQLRSYVNRGGSIVATNATSLYDEWGQARKNFGLADLFGCDYAGKIDPRVQNSYLTVHGPSPFTQGFDDAPRIMGGTVLVHVTPTGTAPAAPITLVPSYQDTPMERLYTKVWETNSPMVYARTVGKGRVVYFPMDLDRTFWEVSNHDHLALLRNAVNWAANGPHPLTITGDGFVDVAYWRQKNSLAAHLVNLDNPMGMKGFMRSARALGPFTVSMELPAGAAVKGVKLLESGQTAQSRQEGGRLIVEVPRVEVHEVVAVDLA